MDAVRRVKIQDFRKGCLAQHDDHAFFINHSYQLFTNLNWDFVLYLDEREHFLSEL